MSERLPPIGEKPRYQKHPPRPEVKILPRKREHRPRKGDYVAFMRQDIMDTFTAPQDMDEEARRAAYSEAWGCSLDDVTICTVAQSYGLQNELKQRYKPKPKGPPKYAYAVRYRSQQIDKPVYNQPLTAGQIEKLKGSYGRNPQFIDVYPLGEEE